MISITRISSSRVSGLFIFCFASAAMFAQGTLTIVNSTFPQGAIGQQYAAALAATGGTAPYTWSASGTLPTGLVLFPTGAITGFPTANGRYTFTLVVTDSAHATASKQVSILIGTGLQQITITTTSLPSALAGQPYSQQLAASGGTPPYQWTGTNVPAGLTLSSGGVLAGTPTTGGTFQFSVQATDSGGTSGSGQISLTIQSPPVSIATVPPLFTGTVGTSYAQPFSATGGQKPYTWSIPSGNTDGLTLDSVTGILSGNPQAAGTFNFTIQVVDAAGNSATSSFSLVVNTPALIITVGSTLQGGTVGVSYSQKLPVQASGGTGPYTWSLAGTPVPGLSLDANTLLLAGTPTTAGNFTLTIQVTDAQGAVATRPIALTIAPATLTITTARQLPDAALSAAYSQQLAASGGQPPYKWSANGLPVGLSINASSGLISGTPTTAGTFGIAVTVSDATLANFVDRFTMDVKLPAAPPVTVSGLPASVSAAQQYNLQVSLGSSYAAPITGQAILTFSPDLGPTDGTIQFSSGGTTANFTIPTGGTSLAAPLAFQTGTVSGTITISLRLQAGGIDITPAPAPSIATQVTRSAPVIRSTQVTRNGNTLNVIVTGYSTAREVTQAVFVFNATSGQALQPAASSITVDTTNLFGNWFTDPANSQFGSVFILTQPFTIQGDVNAVVPVSVTLTNRVGSATANVTP